MKVSYFYTLDRKKQEDIIIGKGMVYMPHVDVDFQHDDLENLPDALQLKLYNKDGIPMVRTTLKAIVANMFKVINIKPMSMYDADELKSENSNIRKMILKGGYGMRLIYSERKWCEIFGIAN